MKVKLRARNNLSEGGVVLVEAVLVEDEVDVGGEEQGRRTSKANGSVDTLLAFPLIC